MTKTYTQEQLDIELLKQRDANNKETFDRLYALIDKVESNQRWILGLMGSGFIGILGLMAHGFKWIV